MAKGESSPKRALRRANRALKTLSDCNLALSQARDETELLHAICRIAVDAGGYRLAWVGYAEQDEKRHVRPVAQAGFEEGYLEAVDITWDDIEQGRGPTGTAIRTCRPAIVTDMHSETTYVLWRAEAIRRGYSSSIALPLLMDGAPFGALTIYAGEPDAFDEEEVALLTELAVNLAYGIAALRARAQRRQVEEALQRRSSQLQMLNLAGQALSSTLDLDEVLRSLLQETGHLFGVHSASVWLVDRKAGDLVCRQAMDSERDTLCGWRLPRGEGLASWVLRHGESLVVSDTRLDDRHFKGVDRQIGAERRSVLTVPLKVKGSVIGVLQLADREAHRFDEGDLVLLEPLAASAAAAIENSRAYREVDRLRRFNENIVCGMDEGVLLEDEKGRITFTNPKTSELLGYAAEDLLGRPALDVVAPESRQRAEVETASRPDGVASRYEIKLQTREGACLPVIVSARPLFDEGRFTGVLAVFADITEQKRTEAALRDRNRELTALNTLASVVNEALDQQEMLGNLLDTVLDLMGLHVGWIYLLEPGREPVTLLLAAQRGIPQEHQQSLQSVDIGDCVIMRVAETGCPAVVTQAHEDPHLGGLFEGQHTEHACVCVPIKSRDSVLGVLGVTVPGQQEPTAGAVELLTSIGHQAGVAVENYRLTRERSEIELLRELNRLRTELVSNVSHELRTPLGLIKILASTLLREDVDFDRATQRELLANIEDEADKLEGIVDNLLDLSRMEGQALRLEYREVDLGQLMRQVVEATAVQYPENAFVLDIPDEPLLITADARRVEQVLRNLLDNAQKYSPEGGPIKIQGRCHGGESFVQVMDKGIGMPVEELDRVFERFYRVENKVTQRARGAGLGLAVCRGIVEMHGGQIWAESTLDEGSTITFTLPLVPMAGGAEEGPDWSELL